MTDNSKFADEVEALVQKNISKMERVAKGSMHAVLEDAQRPVDQGGDMPVSSGELRDSLETTAGLATFKGAESYDLGLRHWNAGDPFQVAWTAPYAISRHYLVGAAGGGGLFRDKAVQKWPGIVRAEIRKVK